MTDRQTDNNKVTLTVSFPSPTDAINELIAFVWYMFVSANTENCLKIFFLALSGVIFLVSFAILLPAFAPLCGIATIALTLVSAGFLLAIALLS